MSTPVQRKVFAKEFIWFLMLFSFLIPENIHSQFCNNGTSSETIIVTQAIQTTTSYSNGRRVFQFDATQDNTYSFNTCNTSTGDTKLRLYDSATGGNSS
jgi:hypothetical protein